MNLRVLATIFLGGVLWLNAGELRLFWGSFWNHELVRAPETTPILPVLSQMETKENTDPVALENRAFSSTYQPVLKPSASKFAVPTAHSAVIIDIDSQETLFENDADDHRQVASLTKLMTALIVVESIKDLNEVVTIDKEAVFAEGTRVGCPRSGYCIGERLKIGEQLRVEDLLKAALMNSANDAAIALGKHIGTTQSGFATIMNKRASELGMTETHFCTPSGLELDGHEHECYSSARDIAKMTIQALKYDVLWQIMRFEEAQISSIDGKYQHDIFNTDELLGQMPNLIGTKTGFTPLAGRTLLAVAHHPESNHRVVAVVLDDQYRWQSIRSMFDWSFQSFSWQ
ncbi:MAG: D-alanyl-D-alanine carboxypeptidase [Candidatus Moranbacteria bacterium]|jgi:D-alanyl-D-alanine carboxypeptidase (penicillin-binding protein 5/6)|nr:D-alanyl-D-alanine carboxypeptidase [Candidatus Moranbacteria bacterium]MBP9801729.1 D-alanyl-D-alanine carboxypeptidase [Candidatus Moranbacteria bacterium]